MRYYLDTEFNGFGGALISIALVPEAEDAPYFYAALPCPDPTLWVAEHVLPVLGTVPIAPDELPLRLEQYLRDDPAPELVADWPEDIAHAARALIAGPGRRINIAPVTFVLCDTHGYDANRESAVPHNAYHDAAGLRRFLMARR